MENLNVINVEIVLKDAVAKCTKESGWANLAEVGTILREKGVKYGKLSKFMDNYTTILETRVDHSLTPPIMYAKLR